MKKNVIKKFILYILILIIIIPVIINILMFLHIFPVKGEVDTWVSSLSSIWGAIIGGVVSGVLTLIGVQLTIKHNNELKKREEYPEKIFRLETVTDFLDKSNDEFEMLLAMDFGEKVNVFFVIDDNYQIIKTHKYYLFTDKLLETINKDIVYVDSKCYRIFFDTRRRINDLYQELMWDSEYALFEFTQDLIGVYAKKGIELFDIEWSTLALNEKQELELSNIKKNLYKNERKYIFHQSEIVKDMYYQLTDHYLKLIKEIDY
ncbi:hypothetical protein EI200_22465 [Peribacillus simplex]|uniref:hypothetical protein n=1 Tax=Peribacillus simplex TaxID=1478 RepID=UPI000F63FFA2|nr:hypothetical protein [Peribacillus simplex]RRN67549.1 hypothetical protein EI200_22465 [Peribacillus simplex]